MKERLDLLSKEGEMLQERPHISIWRTGILKGNRYKPNMWYVSLDWEIPNKNSRSTHCQVFFTKHIPYQKAVSTAAKFGRDLNLPVIKHGLDLEVLWRPEDPITENQIKILSKLLDFKRVKEFPSVSPSL